MVDVSGACKELLENNDGSGGQLGDESGQWMKTVQAEIREMRGLAEEDTFVNPIPLSSSDRVMLHLERKSRPYGEEGEHWYGPDHARELSDRRCPFVTAQESLLRQYAYRNTFLRNIPSVVTP